jgi:hypothetical protein
MLLRTAAAVWRLDAQQLALAVEFAPEEPSPNAN